MKKIPIEKCKKLIDPRSDDVDVGNLRDVFYTLAGAMADCFLSLPTIDQFLLIPPGDPIEALIEREAQLAKAKLGRTQ
jgi:hypothetical protein